MDDFLRLQGASEASGNTYVVTPDDASSEIIAYYTIRPDPEELEDEYNIGDSIIYIVLERLAVDVKYQKQGVGRWILGTLIRQIVAASTAYKIDALVLMPLDADARAYYLSLQAGFEELADGSHRLALSVATMKQV